jgi:hypothetical protein
MSAEQQDWAKLETGAEPQQAAFFLMPSFFQPSLKGLGLSWRIIQVNDNRVMNDIDARDA